MSSIFNVQIVILSVVLVGLSCAELILPSGMKNEPYCRACKELIKGMFSFNEKNGDWLHSTPCKEKFLKTKGMSENEFSTLKRTCLHLIEHYEDEIEQMIKTLPEKQFSAWLCHEKSYACMGLDYDKYEDGVSTEEGTDDEAIKKLIEENKHRIKTPYPHRYKQEL